MAKTLFFSSAQRDRSRHPYCSYFSVDLTNVITGVKEIALGSWTVSNVNPVGAFSFIISESFADEGGDHIPFVVHVPKHKFTSLSSTLTLISNSITRATCLTSGSSYRDSLQNTYSLQQDEDSGRIFLLSNGMAPFNLHLSTSTIEYTQGTVDLSEETYTVDIAGDSPFTPGAVLFVKNRYFRVVSISSKTLTLKSVRPQDAFPPPSEYVERRDFENLIPANSLISHQKGIFTSSEVLFPASPADASLFCVGDESKGISLSVRQQGTVLSLACSGVNDDVLVSALPDLFNDEVHSLAIIIIPKESISLHIDGQEEEILKVSLSSPTWTNGADGFWGGRNILNEPVGRRGAVVVTLDSGTFSGTAFTPGETITIGADTAYVSAWDVINFELTLDDVSTVGAVGQAVVGADASGDIIALRYVPWVQTSTLHYLAGISTLDELQAKDLASQELSIQDGTLVSYLSGDHANTELPRLGFGTQVDYSFSDSSLLPVSGWAVTSLALDSGEVVGDFGLVTRGPLSGVDVGAFLTLSDTTFPPPQTGEVSAVVDSSHLTAQFEIQTWLDAHAGSTARFASYGKYSITSQGLVTVSSVDVSAFSYSSPSGTLQMVMTLNGGKDTLSEVQVGDTATFYPSPAAVADWSFVSATSPVAVGSPSYDISVAHTSLAGRTGVGRWSQSYQDLNTAGNLYYEVTGVTLPSNPVRSLLFKNGHARSGTLVAFKDSSTLLVRAGRTGWQRLGKVENTTQGNGLWDDEGPLSSNVRVYVHVGGDLPSAPAATYQWSDHDFTVETGGEPYTIEVQSDFAGTTSVVFKPENVVFYTSTSSPYYITDGGVAVSNKLENYWARLFVDVNHAGGTYSFKCGMFIVPNKSECPFNFKAGTTKNRNPDTDFNLSNSGARLYTNRGYYDSTFSITTRLPDISEGIPGQCCLYFARQGSNSRGTWIGIKSADGGSNAVFLVRMGNGGSLSITTGGAQTGTHLETAGNNSLFAVWVNLSHASNASIFDGLEHQITWELRPGWQSQTQGIRLWIDDVVYVSNLDATGTYNVYSNKYVGDRESFMDKKNWSNGPPESSARWPYDAWGRNLYGWIGLTCQATGAVEFAGMLNRISDEEELVAELEIPIASYPQFFNDAPHTLGVAVLRSQADVASSSFQGNVHLVIDGYSVGYASSTSGNINPYSQVVNSIDISAVGPDGSLGTAEKLQVPGGMYEGSWLDLAGSYDLPAWSDNLGTISLAGAEMRVFPSADALAMAPLELQSVTFQSTVTLSFILDPSSFSASSVQLVSAIGTPTLVVAPYGPDVARPRPKLLKVSFGQAGEIGPLRANGELAAPLFAAIFPASSDATLEVVGGEESGYVFKSPDPMILSRVTVEVLEEDGVTAAEMDEGEVRLVLKIA